MKAPTPQRLRDLEEQSRRLQRQTDQLQRHSDQLQRENDRLQAERDRLQQEIQRLKQELELARRASKQQAAAFGLGEDSLKRVQVGAGRFVDLGVLAGLNGTKCIRKGIERVCLDTDHPDCLVRQELLDANPGYPFPSLVLLRLAEQLRIRLGRRDDNLPNADSLISSR